MTQQFTLSAIPAPLSWRNLPEEWSSNGHTQLSIRAGKLTDLFIDPAGAVNIDNVPVALFSPPDASFLLSAKVKVEFAATFDAGVLQLRVDQERWAKLCFEFSPQRQPTIVSVVNRGVSDDCNSVAIGGNEVYLRIAHTPKATAFHYSLDNQFWHLVRYFSLGEATTVQAGFSSQSPTGDGCLAILSEIRYVAGVLKDLRSGE
ncbi:MAG: DUF1349 domain-containing protein [Caldilineaceae bacterium]